MSFIKDGKLFGKIQYCWVIMVVCALLQAFAMGLIMSCGSLFYTYICDDLGFLRAEISTYMTGFYIGTAIGTPIAGFILSKFDIRKTMAIAIIVVCSAVIAMSTYTQIWQWQLSGCIIGLFGSCIFVLPGASMVGNWFIKRRGIVYGVVMSCSGISSAVFAQVINNIIMASGWRAGYVFMGVVALCVILPCCLFFRYKPSDIGGKAYGDGDIDPTNLKNQARGVPTKRAVVSISFWCLFIFGGVAAFVHGGINQHIPGYMVQLGLGTAFGATAVSAQSMGSVVDKLVMGWLNDKIGVRRTTLIEITLIFSGLVGFIFLRAEALLLVCAVLIGIQDSLMTVSLPLLIREIFGNKYYTRIHGWIRAGIGLIGMWSGVFVGAVYDYTGMFQPAFVVLCGLLVLAGVAIAVAYVAGKKLVWEDSEAELEMARNS